MLPLGGEDLDKIDGDLLLIIAGNDEIPVTVLGRDEEQAPNPGEVIYKDNLGTICRCWNWREVERTVLSEVAKNCVLVIEALGLITTEELVNAQEELAQLVTKYCGGEVTNFILDSNNTQVELL